MKFSRYTPPAGEKSKSPKPCPNCGFDLTDTDRNRDARVEGDSNQASGHQPQINDEDIKEATRLVVRETMEVIQPLLEKLNQANEEFNNAQANTGTAPSFDQQLSNLQQAAQDRQKLQEQKVAMKMSKLQSRFGNAGPQQLPS